MPFYAIKNDAHLFSKWSRYTRLMSGSALFGLIAIHAAAAQTQAASPEVESVVVTGTSIRGVSPVGTNLITLDRTTLDQTGAQTITQMLGTVPAVTGFGTGGNEFNMGAFGSTGENLPTIHGLGASSSQSTLILVDGHPITPGNKDGYSDPGIIPAAALQRIDVLPDGASAIYGSNAVAGVINFITRKNYEGFQTSGQYGFADSYNSFTFSQLWGHQWETGGVFAVYEYKNASKVTNATRSFSAHQDLRPLGGTNYNSFACSPATISTSTAGTANVYTYPYTSASNLGPASNQDSATCDNQGSNAILPSLNQHTAFLSANQSLTSWLSVQVDLDYTSRLNMLQRPQAALTATAFGSGGSSALNGVNSRNPFYVAPPNGTNVSETVRWDPNAMIGPDRNEVGTRAVFANTTWTADLPFEWQGTLESVSGYNDSFSHDTNRFCSACAILALNGTTSANGGPSTFNSLADPYNLGTTDTVLRTLNAGNALDVWNPAGSTNRTSRDVIASLRGDTAVEDDQSSLNQLRLKFSGSLFDLPAGPVRAAFGGEWNQLHMTVYQSSQNAADSTVSGSRFLYAPMKRTVYAAFAEFYFPVIDEDMNIPLVRSFELNLAGRYDRYSDVGATRNPKVGFTWKMLDGLSWKGSYGTSFTAPNIDALDPRAIATVGGSTVNFVVPSTHVNYAGSFCTVLPAPCSVNGSTMPGVTVGAGNPNLQPARGLSYSLGVNYDMGALAGIEGWTGNFTYWQAKIVGGVTRPPIENELQIPALQPLLLLAPPGGWAPNDPAVINALRAYPITSPLPDRIYYIYQGIRVNAVNIEANGIDYSTQYAFQTDEYGAFRVGASGSATLRYDLAGAIGAPYQDFLNGHQNASVLHSLALTGRLSLGWIFDPFEVNLFTNFSNPYWYPNATTRVATGLTPATGAAPGFIYDKVGATATVDINAGWNLSDDGLYGFGKGMKLTLDINNLFDTNPPFLDTPSGNSNATQTGYDTWHGNLLGRVIRVGVEKKW